MEDLKNEIELMTKNEKIEILKIIKKNNEKYSENDNGIFINMNNLNNKTVKEIKKFLKYSQENNNK